MAQNGKTTGSKDRHFPVLWQADRIESQDVRIQWQVSEPYCVEANGVGKHGSRFEDLAIRSHSSGRVPNLRLVASGHHIRAKAQANHARLIVHMARDIDPNEIS